MNADSREIRVAAHHALQDYGAAIEDCDLLLRINENEGSAWKNRAIAYQAMDTSKRPWQIMTARL